MLNGGGDDAGTSRRGFRATAQAMAQGALKHSRATWALAITIRRPDRRHAGQKPVGMDWSGLGAAQRWLQISDLPVRRHPAGSASRRCVWR